MKRIVLLLAAVTSAAAASPRPLVTQPELGWARSYLLHQILLTEYVTYVEAPQASPHERDKRLSGSQGVALWKRAQFALNAARAAKQNLGETTAARALLLEQMAIVKKRDKKAFATMQAFDAETDEAARRAAAAATFPDAATQDFMAQAASETPACTPSPALTQALLARAAETDATRLGPVLEALRASDVADVRCAVVTWLQHGGEKERLAAQVVVAASSHLPNLAQDATLALLKTTLLLAAQDYAEALRVLFEQQGREAAFRVPYELVQVIFSRRQAGDGSVHINGL